MRFRRLGAALLAAGCLLALGVTSASPAVAQSYPPPFRCTGFLDRGTVTPSPVVTNASFTFSGCGYTPGSTVQLYSNFQYYGSTTADGSGLFEATLTAPPTRGVFRLTAVGQAPGGQLRVTVAIVRVRAG
ncbi:MULTISPECIES: hypothetical protein [Protofrankia]|uniref:Bacterial Ig-like domain-containing protein n=1 Tax=Candidatus Protofrankia datiscae TaxID=2716812 RepID=F8AZI1_9ACTN|nr:MULTISPECIES: hypothetical protein [Protofrankia]AEH08656.1 hypothetical protein FsymDg_1160 [Candidatus Protofrankia datiscae]